MVHLFFLTSLAIVYRDLRTHIISNRSLVLLAVPLLFNYEGFPFAYSVVASLLLLLLSATSGIGGGDVKLMLLLAWLAPHLFFSYKYWFIFSAIALVQIIATRLRTRWQVAHIAMAPAILLPLMAINLGI